MQKLARTLLLAVSILTIAYAPVQAAAPAAPAAATTITIPAMTGGLMAPTAPPAAAPPAQPPGNGPDPSTNFVLSEFMKTGVKVYFLGSQLGLNGWFLNKGNQVQIAYTTPDNQNTVIGVLFNAQGDEVSSQQVKTLYDTNKEVNTLLTGLSAQQNMVPSAMPSTAAAVMPSVTPVIMPPSSPGGTVNTGLAGGGRCEFGGAHGPKALHGRRPQLPTLSCGMDGAA